MLVLKPPSLCFSPFFASTVVLLALWFDFLPLRRGEARKTRSGSLLPGPGARWVSTEEQLFAQIVVFIEPQIALLSTYLPAGITNISK